MRKKHVTNDGRVTSEWLYLVPLKTSVVDRSGKKGIVPFHFGEYSCASYCHHPQIRLKSVNNRALSFSFKYLLRIFSHITQIVSPVKVFALIFPLAKSTCSYFATWRSQNSRWQNNRICVSFSIFSHVRLSANKAYFNHSLMNSPCHF